MLQIFNYNSRSFTTLAIILLIVLGYYSYKSSEPSQTPATESPVGARYVMEMDPSNPDKTFLEKAVMFIFKKNIDKKLKQSSRFPIPLSSHSGDNAYTTKFGDKVTIIYYQTDPMPAFRPLSEDVTIGSNKLPKVVDEMLIGMRVGEKREFKADGISYRVELLDILNRVGEE